MNTAEGKIVGCERVVSLLGIVLSAEREYVYVGSGLIRNQAPLTYYSYP